MSEVLVMTSSKFEHNENPPTAEAKLDEREQLRTTVNTTNADERELTD